MHFHLSTLSLKKFFNISGQSYNNLSFLRVRLLLHPYPWSMDRGSVPRQVQDHNLHLRDLHPRSHPQDYRRRAQHRH